MSDWQGMRLDVAFVSCLACLTCLDKVTQWINLIVHIHAMSLSISKIERCSSGIALICSMGFHPCQLCSPDAWVLIAHDSNPVLHRPCLELNSSFLRFLASLLHTQGLGILSCRSDLLLQPRRVDDLKARIRHLTRAHVVHSRFRRRHNR